VIRYAADFFEGSRYASFDFLWRSRPAIIATLLFFAFEGSIWK
jgi:hypothetical protein